MKLNLLGSITKIYVVFFLFSCSEPLNLFSQQRDNVKNIRLSGLKYMGKIDERYQSFNVEMVEVVGGNFWIPYDKIDTTKKPQEGNVVVGETKSLYRAVPPIDLYAKRLRMHLNEKI